MKDSSFHPMTNAKFHYQFALEDKKEKLEMALAKTPRNDKEVTYLRERVYQLKIANNEKITINTSSTVTSVTSGSNVHGRLDTKALERLYQKS